MREVGHPDRDHLAEDGHHHRPHRGAVEEDHQRRLDASLSPPCVHVMYCSYRLPVHKGPVIHR